MEQDVITQIEMIIKFCPVNILVFMSMRFHNERMFTRLKQVSDSIVIKKEKEMSSKIVYKCTVE